jgi:hypothetical protein
LPAACAAGVSSPAAAAEAAQENPPATPTALFAAVEEAWLKSDAEALASLVDTATVRIALKPGAPPTAAVTRNAAAFLFHDQLRLVETRGFQIKRLTVTKKGAAAAAAWVGDWGGRRGVREVEVVMDAAARAGRWLLTEVHAKD